MDEPHGVRRRARVRPTLPHLAALTWVIAAGCGAEDASDLACPLLAPGATAPLTAQPTLDPSERDRFDGALERGELVTHALALAAGQRVEATAAVSGQRALLYTYGPRDVFGGYPHCRSLALASAASAAVSAIVEAPDGNGTHEYLVVLGTAPGEPGGPYEITVRCLDGCDARPACPTLQTQGCPDARCDGELARDDAGCLTCECAPGALCGPSRAAGPSGACVEPACSCPDAPDAPVCGSDGRTWPSACAARCAGAAPVADRACAFSCPTLAQCDAPCGGARAIGDDGCPTCDCLPEFAADAPSCKSCPDDGAPACGSDGVTYPSRCHARCAGARILYPAACTDGCRAAPAACALDCPWGLRPNVAGATCLSCDCAASPSASCTPSGAPVCARIPGQDSPTTIGAPCLALHLGAEDGAWGPCATRCDDATPCPAGSRCQRHGYLAGRCLTDAHAGCGCSSLLAPVCDTNSVTHANACLAACAGAQTAHLGACCQPSQPADCATGERPTLDARGCPTGACSARAHGAGCAHNAATASACTPDGASLGVSACVAHLDGVTATTAWCTP